MKKREENSLFLKHPVDLNFAPRSFSHTKDEAGNVRGLHMSPTCINKRVGGDHYAHRRVFVTQSTNHSIEI